MTKTSLLILSIALAANTSAALVTANAPVDWNQPRQVDAQLQRLDANAQTRPLTLSLDTPSDITIGEGTWELIITSPELWSAPVVLSDGRDVALQLRRRGRIVGTVGGGAPASGDLRLTFEQKQEGLHGTTTCALRERKWTCDVPAGQLDLQFSLAGFATEFRWGVNVVPEQPANAGKLDFTPGSSLSGSLQLHENQKGTLERTEVSIAHANAGPGDRVRRLVAVANARGFFQFKGVPPGQYLVRATGKDLVTQPRTVDVIAGVNAALRTPLVMASPRRASITLTPPLDSHGEPWLVELYATSWGPAELIGQSLAAESGLWTSAGLIPGNYLLYVRQKNQALWKIHELIMPADDVALVLPVEGQRIVGRVMLGDRPLAATIQFGSEYGEPLVADESGRFEGIVPKSAESKARILVTSDVPAIRRHVEVEGALTPDGDLSYEIQLPNTTILGRTVDEKGTPIAFAILTVRSFEPDLFEQPSSGEDGSFQLAGYEPGSYRLQAESFKKKSAVVEVDASESSSLASIDVVLREEEEVRGEVTMGSVRIAAANIYGLPRDTSTSSVPHAQSDVNGRFVLALPPGTRTYDVIAFSPGFATTAGRIVRDPKRILSVETAQHGGTLIVDAPEGSRPVLVRDRGEFSLQWVAQETGGSVRTEDGIQRFVVPNLEPGDYQVCWNGKCAAVFVPRLATVSLSVAD